MHRYRLFSLIIKDVSGWIHTCNKALTLSWRMPLSYRNQSFDLLCKVIDCFLYDKSLRREWVKTVFTHDTPKVHSYVSWSRISFFCFFYLGFLSQISWFTGQQGKGKGISLYHFYHFCPLHLYFGFSQVIPEES